MDTGSGPTDGTGRVFARLAQHLVALLAARVELTRREIRAAVRDTVLAVVALLAALVLLLLLIPIAVMTLILLLSQSMPLWMATAAVLLVVLLLVAGLAVFARVKLRRRTFSFVQGLLKDWETVRRGLESRR